MKLIDLLVQELPKRGGWPEKAKHRISMHADGDIYFDGKNAPIGFNLPQCDDGWRYKLGMQYTNEVTREQYECALAASQQPAWNGEGFPPVGCECEWQDRNTKQWIKVSVVYASEWVTVIREDKISDAVELAIENYGDEARRQFRPIRTEAERKRDDALSDLEYGLGHAHGLFDLAHIYNLIASGKVRGVKLETN